MARTGSHASRWADTGLRFLISPTFFSTQSAVEVTENTSVNFGIGFSLSGLTGQISNDAGQGVTGVSIKIRNKDQHWTATSDDDGNFAVRQLSEGEYDVEVDEDSVPAGYLTADLTAQHVKVGASIPGRAEFSVRALRSIGGRVLAFDREAGKSVPVASKAVTLKGTAKTSTTDASGKYLFRDLPAGSYTVAVATESGEITKSVKLPPSPQALTNIDFEISAEAAKPAASPIAVPLAAVPLAAVPAAKPGDPIPSNSADEHERIGRQLLGAGHYEEAISELTEAIRLAPGSAPAYNARGYAWFKLYDLSRALQDLDKAIELDPNYTNAKHNREVIRKASGSPPAVDPQEAQKHLEAARRRIQAMQYREAIDELNVSIGLAPDLAIAYNARGFARLKLGDYARAIEDLDRAIRLNPNYTDAYRIRRAAQNALGGR
jgi:Tfp pilus assembly protein PilF/uncharacterized protein (DUF2141 family)